MKKMENKLLEEAREKAYSFPGLIPPNNAEPIGEIEEAHDTYIYYRDSKGNFYYSSGSTRKFEEEMQEAQKRKKERRRWSMGAKKKTAEVASSSGQ